MLVEAAVQRSGPGQHVPTVAGYGDGVGLPAATALVLVLLALVNLCNNRWLPRAYVVTSVVGSAGLLALARGAGLGWEDLGLGPGWVPRGLLWGGPPALALLVGLRVAVGRPGVSGRLRDDRAARSRGSVLYQVLVWVPLGTVLLEEVAFRGVLLGLLEPQVGTLWAVMLSALAFGLWHVLPTAAAARADTVVARALGGRGPGWAVVGGVLLTAAVGTGLAGLRLVAASLLAPALLHLASNSGGYLAAAAVRRPER